SELDGDNPVALCDVAPIKVDTFRMDGGDLFTAPHRTATYLNDQYGRISVESVTANDGGASGSPTTIVRTQSYAWNDAVNANTFSATGTYLIDFPAFGDVEDSSGNRYRCTYLSYDGQPNAIGQMSGLTLGNTTRADGYTACGTAANGFTPSGQISTTHTY